MKEYVVIYKSEEHFEVLGWVAAENLEEAKQVALQKLKKEADHYEVVEADIVEYSDPQVIKFR